MRKLVCFAFLFSCLIPAFAKPKERIYQGTPASVFQAALRTAREQHVVTYVDDKNLMMTFETGVSALSYGFVANASVEQQTDGSTKLIINVQHKNDGKNVSYSFNAGDRMANKFFDQVQVELARTPAQNSAAKSDTPPAEAAPQAKPAAALPDQGQNATVNISSTPDAADISIDGNFVGNSPSTLKLSPGKHTIAVTSSGYKDWSRDLSVNSGSEIRLNAALEKK